MTVVPNFDPNPIFASLASDEAIARTVAALTARGFVPEVVSDGAAARARVLELLPLGAEVFTSLSETLTHIGVAADINESGRYDAIRPKLSQLDRAAQQREIRKLAAAPDFVVGSVAAITEDGQLMIASGSGSQLGHYAYEAGKVILVAGTQKIVRDSAEGLRRIEEYSLPLENARMMKALGRPSALMKILTVRGERGGRITIILVKEKLGF